ncbi:MAG: TolC family protein [Paramuribaculum sp.]|nr:TolC family protein [Paramuribaculum sp.]
MKHKVIIIGLSMVCSFYAHSERISQNAFLKIVDNIAINNKEVMAAVAQDASVNASLSINNRLPAPELSFGHLWGQRGIGNKWNVEVSQSFDWPGMYSARREANRYQSLASEASVAKSIYDARCNTAQALISAIYYDKLTQLYSSNLSRVDSLLDLYNRGYKMGEISILDVNKLKIDRIAANRALASAKEGYTESISLLRELNNNEGVDDVLSQLPDFPDINLLGLNTYVAEISRYNAELNYKQHQAGVAKANVKLAQQSKYPGFSVGYSHEYEMGENFNGLTVGITLPFLTSGKSVTAARLEQLALEAEADALQTAIASRITGLYNRALLLYDEQTQYSKVLSDDDSVRLLNLALRQGHITLIDYMLQVNFFTEAKATYLEVQHNYLQAAIALNLQILPTGFSAQ